MLFWQFSKIIINVKIVEGEKTRSALECMVILKYRGQGPKKMEKYGTNMSRAFNKNLDLFPWLDCRISIHSNVDLVFFQQFWHVGKLPEQHFSEWLLSNPGNKILFFVEILWSQELRVEQKDFWCQTMEDPGPNLK